MHGLSVAESLELRFKLRKTRAAVLENKKTMRHTQFIPQTIVLFGLVIGNVHSEPLTFKTARDIYPEKSVEQVEEAVGFLSKQQQPVPVRVEEFKTPVEYMTRLRRFRVQYPNEQSGPVGRADIRRAESESIEQIVHNWTDLICVKWEIPKAYVIETSGTGKKACPACEGRGSKDIFSPETKMIKCPECLGGSKQVAYDSRGGRRVVKTSVVCFRCNGRGEVASTHTKTTNVKCGDCGGTGKVDVQTSPQSILLLIPKYDSMGGESK